MTATHRLVHIVPTITIINVVSYINVISIAIKTENYHLVCFFSYTETRTITIIMFWAIAKYIVAHFLLIIIKLRSSWRK